MMKKTFLLILLCLSWMTTQAQTFANEYLKELGTCIGLQQFEGLKPGVYTHLRYRQRPLSVRVNQWNEIEHIGLLLFPQGIRAARPMPVYDFLERYLLSRNAFPANSEYGTKLAWENVHFATGSYQTALSLDTTCMFSESHVDLKVYKVAWKKSGKKVLEMSFLMDWQLLVGCNAIELEASLFKNLQRTVRRGKTDTPLSLPVDGTEYKQEGKSFIMPLINNNLYFSRPNTDAPWTLTSSPQKPARSITNILLSEAATTPLKVHITLNRYGLRTYSCTIDYRIFLQYCQDEGCIAYCGIKEKTETEYRCTVLMVNQLGGYAHLLSIDVPVSVLEKDSDAISQARIHSYIPLHNVTAQMAESNEYEPVN